jgi:hypothetical protein
LESFAVQRTAEETGRLTQEKVSIYLREKRLLSEVDFGSFINEMRDSEKH